MTSNLLVSRRGAWLLAGSTLLAGCFGSFGATNLLYDWNKGVSNNKWIRWLVFLVLVIVPVYGLFIMADALVLNTIEFFSGKNPVKRANLGNGRTLRTSRTPDRELVKHEIEEHGEVVRTLYVRRVSPNALQLLDEQLRAIGSAEILEDGSVEVRDGHDRILSKIAPEQVERADAALQAGACPSNAVAAAMGPSDARS